MKRTPLVALSLLAIALSGCGEKPQEPAKAVEAPAPAPKGPNLTQVPEVGKVESESLVTSGTGVTPGAATNEALKSAIMQINGVTVEAASANLDVYATATATLDVESSEGKDHAAATSTLQGQAFANEIISRSNGTISSFRVIKTTPPAEGSNLYSVEIEIKAAKFKKPADSGKLKIVVAPLRSDKASFNIAGKSVPASEVLDQLRQQIIDNLTQTGRFNVLDRQFEGELAEEMNMISSGQTDKMDLAKMGQALSADVVWVGVVNDFAFNKSVRKLQTSDRELVSYAGGWSVSQRIINLATKQILQSNTIEGTPPSIAPTTLGAPVDETATLKGMTGDFVKKSTEAILLRTVPISIVERDGNTVVLSQGGKAMTEGARYRVFKLGKEIMDPQTGQSLGNMESPCCDVLVTRVTPNLSYGTLENVQASLDGVAPGALQLREVVPASAAKPAEVADAKSVEAPAATVTAEASAAVTATAAASVARAKSAAPKANAPASANEEKEDW